MPDELNQCKSAPQIATSQLAEIQDVLRLFCDRCPAVQSAKNLENVIFSRLKNLENVIFDTCYVHIGALFAPSSGLIVWKTQKSACKRFALNGNDKEFVFLLQAGM